MEVGRVGVDTRSQKGRGLGNVRANGTRRREEIGPIVGKSRDSGKQEGTWESIQSTEHFTKVSRLKTRKSRNRVQH